jgi:thioredoxin-like negative regulator of GroEL
MKLYYFSAGWCAPCKAMYPLVKEHNNIEIIDVESEEGSKLAGRFSVRGIPTLIAYDEVNDKLIDQMIGAKSKSIIAEFVEINK